MSRLRSGESERFVKFAIVGSSNTVVSLVVYACLLWLEVPYVAATVLAVTVGTVNGYFLNRFWTFRDSGARGIATASRYVATQTAGLALNVAVLAALVEIAGVDELAAQAVAVPAALLVTYGVNRRWTFVARHREAELSRLPG